MTRRLVLWRHGQTAWNAQGRAQGQHDVPLDETGVSQARAAATRLASLEPAGIVSSDLARAADTAAELARLTGIEVQYDRRLREVHFGEREGLTMEESLARFPDVTRRWLRAENVRFPGGETYRETAQRFAAALTDLAAQTNDGDTVVVAAHGGAMRVGTGAFLRFPSSLWQAFGGFANCNWAVLVEARLGWRIDEWNAGSLPEPVMGDDELRPAGIAGSDGTRAGARAGTGDAPAGGTHRPAGTSARSALPEGGWPARDDEVMTSIDGAIRPVQPADLSELVPLMEAYCGFYDTAPGAAALTVLAQSLLAEPECEGMQMLARDRHGRAVGFATMYWSWDTTEAVRIAIMHDLYVDPEVRGTGVGRALLEACGAEAARRGKGRLDWQTAPGNVRAQRLYDAVTADRSTWVCYGLAL